MPYGVIEQSENNALFLRVLHLFLPCGQLLLRAAVDDIDFLRAQALCAARGVHRDVSSPHDRHALRAHDRRGGILPVSLHQIYAGQKLVGGIHAVEVLAFDPHEFGEPRARPDKDALVTALLHQLVDGNRSADDDVRSDFHAQLFKLSHFLSHDLLGEAEFGDPVNQHAARQV